MDIYDYLKMDHAKVEHLFKLYQKSTLIKRQQDFVDLIIQELLVHAEAEQQVFYKELLKHPKTRELGLHGEKEHQEIEEQINLLSNCVGKQWKSMVLKLKELVEHHVKEEEHSIFSLAKKVLSAKEAWILKEKMHYTKAKLLLRMQSKSRPHFKEAKRMLQQKLQKVKPSASRTEVAPRT